MKLDLRITSINKFLIFATSIVFISCENQTSHEIAISENEKIVRQYYEFFNQHNWVKMSEMYAEVSDFKDPSLGEGIVKQTRLEILEKYKSLGAIYSNVTDRIVQIYNTSDNYIIVEFISTGTALDGTKFELPICTIFKIENGKITKDFTYYDNFEN